MACRPAGRLTRATGPWVTAPINLGRSRATSVTGPTVSTSIATPVAPCSETARCLNEPNGRWIAG